MKALPADTVCPRCGSKVVDPRPYAPSFECGGPGGEECDRRAAAAAGEADGHAVYIGPADVADAPDEFPPEADPVDDPDALEEEPSRPTVDRALLLGIAAMLDAQRSQIDAALLLLDAVLEDAPEHPVEVASSGVTGDDVECPHPVSQRQSMNTIGSGDDTPRWRCRGCGYIHDPPRRD